MAADPALVAETNFTPAEAAARALELLTLAEPPTALMCSGDLIAQGALAAAQKLGLRVPADLSLVSLSALPGQRVTAPGIAAVISDFEEAGATASRLLLDLISGAPASHRPPALADRLRPRRLPRPSRAVGARTGTAGTLTPAGSHPGMAATSPVLVVVAATFVVQDLDDFLCEGLAVEALPHAEFGGSPVRLQSASLRFKLEGHGRLTGLRVV